MRRNKRKQRAVRLGGLVLLIVVLAGFMMLFQVRTVNVYGNSRHAAEEISDGLLDGFLMKNTLYLQWKYRNGTIPDTLPFLDSIKVQMKSPFEVRVDVSERDPVAYVNKGSNAYFDENGLVLAITDEVYDGVPVVTGADVDTPVLYQKLPVISSAQLRTILSVTQLLKYQELEAKEIRFDESGDITVYIGKVEAMLGQDEYMEEKIANLRAILKKMGNESGRRRMQQVIPAEMILPQPEMPGRALIHRRPGMRQSEMTRTIAVRLLPMITRTTTVRLLPMITWMAARSRQEIRLRQSAWYLIPRERLCTMFM